MKSNFTHFFSIRISHLLSKSTKSNIIQITQPKPVSTDALINTRNTIGTLLQSSDRLINHIIRNTNMIDRRIVLPAQNQWRDRNDHRSVVWISSPMVDHLEQYFHPFKANQLFARGFGRWSPHLQVLVHHLNEQIGAMGAFALCFEEATNGLGQRNGRPEEVKVFDHFANDEEELGE